MDLTKFGAEDAKKPKSVSDEKLSVDTKDISKEFSTKQEERFLPWFLKYKLDSFEKLILTPDIKKVVSYIENFL